MPQTLRRHRAPLLVGLCLVPLLAGCARENEIDVTSGVGITALRSACPATGVPVYTGDVTTFDPADRRDAGAIDVTATITNLTASCNDTGERVYSQADFDVIATRREAGPARAVDLPFFSSVVQGGTAVVAKRVGTVRVTFADGAARGTGRGQAGAYVDRAAATLPAEIQERISRKRKAGDVDAAVDPLAEPEVRAAVQRATFEHLIGFQLTNEQLEYNVRR